MKITFLFGAGAEGAGQIGMPFGNEFKKDMILAKNVASFIKSINNSTKPILPIREGTNIAYNSSGILYQTLAEMKEYDSSCMDKLFSKESDRQTAKEYLEYKQGESNPDNDTKQRIIESFSKLYRENFYDVVKYGTSNEELEYFLKNAGIYAYLDGLFGYLRKPTLYPKECARIVKFYFSAMYSMLKSLYKRNNTLATNVEYVSVLSSLDRTTLPSFIEEQQQLIIEDVTKSKEKTYYGYINKLKNKVESDTQKIDLSVINLNYTSFAEKIISLDRENIAYLHGKLGLFEELKTKRIGELCELDVDETVFPYLLVQSGIKPIISPRQIEEFGKAANWMRKADMIVILGYGVNSDDEHISNFLRWRIDNDKRVVCFIHENSEDTAFKNEMKRIQRQLGNSPNLEFKSTLDFEKFIEQVTVNGGQQ